MIGDIVIRKVILAVLSVLMVAQLSFAASQDPFQDLMQQIEVEQQNLLFLQDYKDKFEGVADSKMKKYQRDGVAQSDLTQANLDVAAAKTRLANIEIKIADAIDKKKIINLANKIDVLATMLFKE